MARTTKNLAEVIRQKLASDSDLAEAVESERFNASVGSAILSARKEAGMTQKQLADSVGMQQSVIARLEDADYDSHSLKVLRRIAEALGKRVDVRFVPLMNLSDGTSSQETRSRSRPPVPTKVVKGR